MVQVHWLYSIVTSRPLNAERGELVITNDDNQEELAHYTDLWAEVLRGQGWIGGAEKAIAQPQEWPEEKNAPFMPPSVVELWALVDEQGKSIATDWCLCDIDGTCEHGHQ